MRIVNALMKYFGKKEGQTLREFADEVSLLTGKDKVELAEMLSKELGEPVEVGEDK